MAVTSGAFHRLQIYRPIEQELVQNHFHATAFSGDAVFEITIGSETRIDLHFGNAPVQIDQQRNTRTRGTAITVTAISNKSSEIKLGWQCVVPHVDL